jgi:hypothetical protein
MPVPTPNVKYFDPFKNFKYAKGYKYYSRIQL